MNENLRKLIHRCRVDKHLNFRQLAELSGYRNSNKWASRICNFEREGYGPDEMIRNLIEALEIPFDEVRTANRQDLDKYQSWLDEPVPIELLIKPLPGLYWGVKIPDDIDTEERATEFAVSKSKKFNADSCLIISRKKCIWFNPDGSIKCEGKNQDGLVEPFMVLGNKQFIFKMRES